MKPYVRKGRSHGHWVPTVIQATTAAPPATSRAETSFTGFGKLKTSLRVMA